MFINIFHINFLAHQTQKHQQKNKENTRKKGKDKGLQRKQRGLQKKENGLQGNAINDFYFSTTGYVYRLHLLWIVSKDIVMLLFPN